MQAAFFASARFAHLEQGLQKRYPAHRFIIRHKEAQFYYLIFDDDALVRSNDSEAEIAGFIKEINKRIHMADEDKPARKTPLARRLATAPFANPLIPTKYK